VKRWFSRSELLSIIGQCCMDGAWVYACSSVVTALVPSALDLSLGRVLLLPLTAALGVRAVVALRWPVLVQLVAAVLVLGQFLFSTLAPSAWTLRAITQPWQYGVNISGPLTFLVWLVGIFLSARGLLIGARSAEAASVRRWFLVGAIGFVGLFALLARAGVAIAELPSVELQALTSGYFLGGSCVCASIERHTAHARQQLPLQHTVVFAVALALPVAALALSSALVAVGAFGVRTLIEQGQQLGFWLLQLVWSVCFEIAKLIAGFLRLLAVAFGEAQPESSQPGPGTAHKVFGLGRWHNPLTRAELDALPGVLGLAVLLIVGWYMFFLLRRRVQADAADIVEDSSSLWSWGRALERLRARLLALRSRVERGRGQLAELVNEYRAPRDMRAVYRQLLRWAAAHGHPRRPGMTPLELAEQLERAYPERRPELHAITLYYNAARYGAATESEQTLEHARALLDALHELGAAAHGRKRRGPFSQ
jgi:hypothetical protein